MCRFRHIRCFDSVRYHISITRLHIRYITLLVLDEAVGTIVLTGCGFYSLRVTGVAYKTSASTLVIHKPFIYTQTSCILTMDNFLSRCISPRTTRCKAPRLTGRNQPDICARSPLTTSSDRSSQERISICTWVGGAALINVPLVSFPSLSVAS